MNDDSSYPSEWSERKVVESIDAAIVLAISAPTPNLKMGYLGSATALLNMMFSRAQEIAAQTR